MEDKYKNRWGESFDVAEMKRLLAVLEKMPRKPGDPMTDLRSAFLRNILSQQQSDLSRIHQQRTTTEMIGQNKSIRAILWDNDGVLMDSESLFFDVTRRVFREHNVKLEPSYWATNFLGRGMRTFEIAEALGMDPEDAIRAASHRDILWRQRIKDPVPVCPGAVDVLDLLGKTFRMVVVSGAPREHFEDVHRSSGLLRFFETSITMDECPRVKPAPDAYLMAAAQMGVQPSECLVIEDSPRGFRAVQAAGMRCVLVATTLTDLSLCDDADIIVRGLPEILKLSVITRG
ncbi:MAG TPA: HAD family phosphatase [Fibrobacteraceae bacterium]|nr:HAD family phosphatase [Fibrobacteraceae bacterium]